MYALAAWMITSWRRPISSSAVWLLPGNVIIVVHRDAYRTFFFFFFFFFFNLLNFVFLLHSHLGRVQR